MVTATERQKVRHRPVKEWVHRWFGWWLRDAVWYRKWFGGHWEHWLLDQPLGNKVWLDQPGCARLNTSLRPAVGRGQPDCEDYPVKVA